jgi:hypothetical protein
MHIALGDAATVRHTLTMADRGASTTMRFMGAPIDGSLIDGTVIDGTLTEGTLIEGRLTEGSLIEGRWIDGRLIAGRWIEGRLIEGNFGLRIFITMSSPPSVVIASQSPYARMLSAPQRPGREPPYRYLQSAHYRTYHRHHKISGGSSVLPAFPN